MVPPPSAADAPPTERVSRLNRSRLLELVLLVLAVILFVMPVFQYYYVLQKRYHVKHGKSRDEYRPNEGPKRTWAAALYTKGRGPGGAKGELLGASDGMVALENRDLAGGSPKRRGRLECENNWSLRFRPAEAAGSSSRQQQR